MLSRFYWHTKELKSKLADAFNASYNMVTDSLQLWRNQPAITTDLQECQRVLAEVNEMYQRYLCSVGSCSLPSSGSVLCRSHGFCALHQPGDSSRRSTANCWALSALT